MKIQAAMEAACAEIGIRPPKRHAIGIWLPCDTFKRSGKNDGRVRFNNDGVTGVAWNHQTGQYARFSIDGTSLSQAERREVQRKAEKQRRVDAEKRITAAKTAESILRACNMDVHPYLASKGFPKDRLPVIENMRPHAPDTYWGNVLRDWLPTPEDGPFLIVPGRHGKRLASLQFIMPDGAKKNMLFGPMSGTFHRLSSGVDEIWVCEGIATGLSVRDALKFLGGRITVLVAFSAANVSKVARQHNGIIAADNDPPVETFDNRGTGEHFARQSGQPWIMPPEPGDFNDMHQAHGLRQIARTIGHLKPL